MTGRCSICYETGGCDCSAANDTIRESFEARYKSIVYEIWNNGWQDGYKTALTRNDTPEAAKVGQKTYRKPQTSREDELEKLLKVCRSVIAVGSGAQYTLDVRRDITSQIDKLIDESNAANRRG